MLAQYLNIIACFFQGYETHIGLAKLVGIKAEDDCAVVKV